VHSGPLTLAESAAIGEDARIDVEPPTADEYRQAAELRAALRFYARRSEGIARRHGITPRQYHLLLMIKGSPGGAQRSTVTGIAEQLQLTQSSVTELVTRAQEAGLIRRVSSERDGRVVDLLLTPLAEEKLAAVVTEHGPDRRRLLDILSTLDRGSGAV
jgi:DNA-binding MarR family transcriptional regulator